MAEEHHQLDINTNRTTINVGSHSHNNFLDGRAKEGTKTANHRLSTFHPSVLHS